MGKVFISYSHDSEEHAKQVLSFSNLLVKDGIDCVLDQYTPNPAEGWPRWMDRNIIEAEFVLMICTHTYYNRVMGLEVAGTGLGVKWEGNIIYNRIIGMIQLMKSLFLFCLLLLKRNISPSQYRVRHFTWSRIQKDTLRYTGTLPISLK